MDDKHPDWKDHERLRAQRIADSLKPYLRSGGLRFLPKPEHFFVWTKDLQEIVDLAAQVPAPGASFGASTTHMGKLLPKVEGGGGGGCPLLVLGITANLYDDDEPLAEAIQEAAVAPELPEDTEEP